MVKENMTYQDLLEQLQKLSPEELKQTVLVYVDYDEFLPLCCIKTVEGSDIVDNGQYVISYINF